MPARRCPPTRPRPACTCRILVPETASYPKIAQIAACGADVVTIKGSRQDVAEAALRQSAEIFYASHNWQPFFVEGIKTLAYELWEQLGLPRARQPRGPARLRQQRARRRRAASPSSRARGEIGTAAAALRRAGGALRAVRRRVPGGRRAPRADGRSRPTVAEGIATPSPRAWPRCCAPCATSGGSDRGGRGSGDRGGAARSRPPRALRRAHLRGRRGRPDPPARRAAPSGRTSARCWC